MQPDRVPDAVAPEAAPEMLPERLWRVLDALSDGPLQVDEICAEYAAAVPGAWFHHMLDDLIGLKARGLVALSPPRPAGLQVRLTPTGEAEWDDARYAPYWQAPAAARENAPEKNPAFPRRVKYAVIGLCLVVLAVALWGYIQGTYSMSTDTAVDLSACVPPMRATLAAAGAPDKILRELELAGQRGIWQTAAQGYLVDANQALKELPAGVQEELGPKLQNLINACQPNGRNCWCR